MDKILIKNGTIVDGTGNKPFVGDLLLQNGLIEHVGGISNVDVHDAYIINADGKYITPGYFDAHRHCDYAVFKEGFGEIELSQGITSTVTGSCGLTPFPFKDSYRAQLDNLLNPCLGDCPNGYNFESYRNYLDQLKKQNLPINIGNLIGSCSVRIAAKGFGNTPFSRYEMDLAKSYIEEAMQEGALGLSMGIMYFPEYYSTKDELIQMAKVAAKYNGVLTCHIRGEGDSLVASVEEIVYIAERADIPLQISHFKSCGVENWGRDIFKAMERIELKRESGMDINVDFYPYNGGATTLISLIPPTFMKETLNETWDYMSKKEAVDNLRNQLSVKYDTWDNYVLSLGFDKIIISSVQLASNQKYIGKSIKQVSEEFNLDPFEFICSIMWEEQGNVGIIIMSMSKDDVDAVAKLPYSFLISDALYSKTDNPHPRLYASFAKFIRDFVIDRKTIPLEEAIRKMTYMPAKKMGITNRGLLKESFQADINIFSPHNIKDHSDFGNAKILSSGMDYVLVNGEIAYQNEKMNNQSFGKILKIQT